MSSATALTIIAISVGLLALFAIVAIIFLLRLVVHLISFEKTLVEELAELRTLVAHVRETTDRVGHTVRDVQVAAQRVGTIVGAVATLFAGRAASKSDTAQRKRAWWVTGASLGWSLIKKRRQKARKKTAVLPAQDKSVSL